MLQICLLFSGIGGFCFGFEAAGLKTLWAVDNNEAVIKTYGLNFQHVETICDDIIKLNDKKTKLTPVDILHAGFPCQSFSVAGNRRGFDDPRGKVFFEILHLLVFLYPGKTFVIAFLCFNTMLYKPSGICDKFNSILK